MNLSTYIELEIEVDYDYQPSEKATNTYPGCNSSVELNAVVVRGIDILGSLDSRCKEEITQQCLEKEDPSLLTDVHFPDLDKNLRKLSITL